MRQAIPIQPRYRPVRSSAARSLAGIILTIVSGVCSACFNPAGPDPAPLSVHTATFDPVRMNTACAQGIRVTGGSGSYRFTVCEGVLPAGLALSPGTGYLRGVVTSAPGEYLFSVRVQDRTDPSRLITVPLSVTVEPLLWRIMVYMAADNSLSEFAKGDLAELEAADLSGTGIGITVLQDLQGPGNTSLYQVRYDAEPGDGVFSSLALPLSTLPLELGLQTQELDMGDPAVLIAFLEYGETMLPADHNMLVIWNHGSGWRGAGDHARGSPLRTLCEDTASGDSVLYTAELGEALFGKHIDVLGFDLCYGAMLELMYELREYGRFFIASEEAEQAGGWNYTEILTGFINTDMTPVRMAETVVEAYSHTYANAPGMTLSVVDLSRTADLYAALNALSRRLSDACTSIPEAGETLRELLLDTVESFHGTSYPSELNIDLCDLARKVSSLTDYADDEADALETAISSAVVSEWHHAGDGTVGNPDASGIAVHLVRLASAGTPDGHDEAYFREFGSTVVSRNKHPLAFTADSLWVPSLDTEDGLLYHLFHSSPRRASEDSP